MDIPALGILSAVLAGATVFTTSMIYAQLKTVPRWNHFGTPLMFLAYAAAGGAMLYAAIVNGSLIWLALLGLLVAVGVQIAWRALAAARPLSLAGTPRRPLDLAIWAECACSKTPQRQKLSVERDGLPVGA